MHLTWSSARTLVALACGGLILYETAAQVVHGTQHATLAACLIGLLPVAFFMVGTNQAHALFSIASIAALVGYTSVWIWAVHQFNPDKYDGLPGMYPLVAVFGVLLLLPGVGAHWIDAARRWHREPSATEPFPLQTGDE